jgi:RNA polymerase sigma factor (TIGR02999 family)
MAEVTDILNTLEAGDLQAVEQFLPLVYAELRQLAAAKLCHERPGQTLDATGLVHEAYLRLVGDGSAVAEGLPAFANRRHFFGAAAEAMRRILVENARRNRSRKRGGDRKRVPLDDVAAPEADQTLLELDAALTRLAAEDPIAAQVVSLHHFAGLGHQQVAETLRLTVYQARQKWTYARAWLKAALRDS